MHGATIRFIKKCSYVMFGVWCAVSAAKIIGLFVTGDHKFTTLCCTHSDTMFEHLSDYERTRADLQPDNVAAHIEDRSTR